jgi:membrane protein
LAAAGCNLYAQYLGTFNKTYGVLGVFVILMVWIYLSSLIILAGAEINSELTKMMDRNGAMVPDGSPHQPSGNFVDSRP